MKKQSDLTQLQGFKLPQKPNLSLRGGHTGWKLYFLLGFLAIIGFRPDSLLAQTISCPTPAATLGSGSVPFSTNWDANLVASPRTIPVVVHLIGSSPAALTPTQVNIAIQQLNADFVAPNPSWGIQFRLAGVAPDGSCTNGITSHSDLYHYSNFKSLTGWPNDRYLNIWVVIQVNGDPGILGAVSVLPTLFAENSTCDGLDRLDRIAGQTPSFDAEDGVVIKLDEFYPNNANRHTLTHEVGHWLNLLHIFQDGPPGACFWSNCHPLAELAINGDLIDDTNPQQQVLTFNPATCTTNAGECTSGVTADLDNFMGYAHPCQTTFTQRQREWMFACLDLNRPLLSSTENLECTGVISTSSDISGNITWDLSNVPTGVMQVTAEIHILSNSSLTVAAGITVRFCENAKLVVDPGGRLVLNGTLTNACEGKMWAGVEVLGDGTSNTQWPDLSGAYDHGRLIANTGSVIQNAIIGIFVGDAGGGIVQCTGTTFLNNQKGVQFEPFENHNPFSGNVTTNSSHFSACEFTTDSDYLGDNPSIYPPGQQKKFAVFAELRGVRGISFLGCDFANTRTDYIFNFDFGRGILSTESGFSVGNLCTGSSLPCPSANQVKSTFKNLYEGIFVGETDISGVLPKHYSVQSALFQGCWTGIRSEEGSRGFIILNTFEIGNVPVPSADLAIIGVLLESGHTTFTLEENTFRLGQIILPDILQSGVLFIGSRAYWIGENNNIIRKNYYQNLTIGNESVGDNANALGTTGLHYFCNENENNSPYDFNVRFGRGVRRLQGEMPFFGGNIPAGNIFSLINLPESDFRNSATNNILYIHRAVVPETPITFSGGGSFTLLSTTRNKSCESIYCDPPCGSEEQMDEAMEAITESKSELETLQESFLLESDSLEVEAQKNTMSALQAVMQENTFEVLRYIVANEGSLEDYRYWLGYLDAYETDLALAKSYIGTGEFDQASALLSTLPGKHSLEGHKLEEFNGYLAVLNILQAHLEGGGNKFNLPAEGIEALRDYAEQSTFARVRGQAKAMLAMYGILYPPEDAVEVEERSSLVQSDATATFFTLMPNPANQSVWLNLKTVDHTADLTGVASLYNPQGSLVLQQQISAGTNGVFIPLTDQTNGFYWVQVRLSNGKIATLPLVIAR